MGSGPDLYPRRTLNHHKPCREKACKRGMHCRNGLAKSGSKLSNTLNPGRKLSNTIRIRIQVAPVDTGRVFGHFVAEINLLETAQCLHKDSGVDKVYGYGFSAFTKH